MVYAPRGGLACVICATPDRTPPAWRRSLVRVPVTDLERQALMGSFPAGSLKHQFLSTHSIHELREWAERVAYLDIAVSGVRRAPEAWRQRILAANQLSGCAAVWGRRQVPVPTTPQELETAKARYSERTILGRVLRKLTLDELQQYREFMHLDSALQSACQLPPRRSENPAAAPLMRHACPRSARKCELAVPTTEQELQLVKEMHAPRSRTGRFVRERTLAELQALAASHKTLSSAVRGAYARAHWGGTQGTRAWHGSCAHRVGTS